MRQAITEPSSTTGPLWRRLAWFVAIWTGSVLTLGVVAYGIRLFIKP